MPKNQYFIPKENIAKIEEVREIENKEQITPEEKEQIIDIFKERANLINNKSKLSPAARSKIVKKHGADYLSERAFNNDIALMQMYGPGFWEGVWNVTKKVGGVALAVSYATPIAPFTMTATAAATGLAVAMKEYGDEDCQKVVGEIADVVLTAVETQDIAGEGYSGYRTLKRK